MFLLDTNVVSAARKREPAVAAWIDKQGRGDLSLSVITLGEIQCSIQMKQLQIKQRQDP